MAAILSMPGTLCLTSTGYLGTMAANCRAGAFLMIGLASIARRRTPLVYLMPMARAVGRCVISRIARETTWDKRVRPVAKILTKTLHRPR